MDTQLSLFEPAAPPQPSRSAHAGGAAAAEGPGPAAGAAAPAATAAPAAATAPEQQGASGCRRRPRRRDPHPRAAAHALALQNLDLADAVARNFARRTIHPFDDLRQVAVIGLLKAAQRYSPSQGRPFRPYARTYANGEVIHYLRDCGFAIKVPPTWRDQFASGQKLLRQGTPPAHIPQRLGISNQRWLDIQEACSITVVALPPET